jgi:hypothetical protein
VGLLSDLQLLGANFWIPITNSPRFGAEPRRFIHFTRKESFMNPKTEFKNGTGTLFKKLAAVQTILLWPCLAALALVLTVPARAQTFTDAEWVSLGSGTSGYSNYTCVCALAVSGTNLYAAGNFSTAGGVAANDIAKWNGSAWSGLGWGYSGGSNNDNWVFALAVSGTNLYAGGSFNWIAKWNSSAWSFLGSGIGGFYFFAPYVSALAVSGTNLYAGGSFSTVGGVTANSIAKWDGSAWSALGSGMNAAGYPGWFPRVYALAVSGTNLYAGGSFSSAGGVPAYNIAKWDGSAWSALGSGITDGTSPCYVFALAVSGTNLYAGGEDFTTAGGMPVNYIAKWDGSSWSALGSSVEMFVGALAVSGTNLYVGGALITAGGVPVNNIAKWDGSSWSALGSGVSGGPNPCVHALATDGAEHLFVGGNFYLAGTNVSSDIAQANLPSVPAILMAPQTQTAEAGATAYLEVNATGEPQPVYQWYFNGTNILSCTNCRLVLTNIPYAQSGTFTVVVTNYLGAVTSAPATFNVIAPVARRLVPGVNLTAQAGNFLGLNYRDDLGPTANWQTLATMTLSNSSQLYLDLSEPLPPQRFYRAWQSGTPGVVPSLSVIGMVPAITLAGNVGDSLRLDYINQFGPIDAWVTLVTVTLTNTSQLYFDVSALGQPARLWRIVPAH